MRFSTAVVAAVALFVASAAAAPSGKSLHKVAKYDGETTGKYIVTLKTDVAASKKASVASAKGIKNKVEFSNFNGFSAELDDEALEALRASDEVASIEEDGVMHTFVTQTNAPWGLQRISQRAALTSTNTAALTYTYTYNTSPGAGVDIYIVDTGVYTAHTQFGGRATWGATFGGYANADGNGHGTHCAGTAAGSQYGVSKSANIIAVKILSDAGSGSTTDIVSGLNWVLTRARSTGRPSVVSMSLGGGASTALDNAVASLTAGGVHVVVAAGNSNTNAANTSPARAPSAITVGASTIADARASFSNYGAVVDVFAPGQNVISSWIGSTTATNNISGTSMATPHVAGLAAYLLGQSNSTPAALATRIINLSLSGVLSGIPSGTANRLIQNF